MYGYKTSTNNPNNTSDLKEECTKHCKKVQLEVETKSPRQECFTGGTLSEHESIKEQYKR